MFKLWRMYWVRIGIALLIIFITSAALLFGYVWRKLDRISYDQETVPLETFEEIQVPDEEIELDIEGLDVLDSELIIPDSETKMSHDVINILLIGSDERTSNFNASSRADSITIVSINKEKNTVRLVSLERGTGVPILEGQYAGEYDMLTHIFHWGGADLLVKTVEHCFKIDIDHYVRLNFNSVTKIVDAIGGITVDLTLAEACGMNDARFEGESPIPEVNGPVRMNGTKALRYARLRSIDSNWKRVIRQRKVILAVVDELKDSSVSELNELADIVLPMINTNMEKTDVAELLLYAPVFFNSQFDQLTIPKAGTYGAMKIRNGGYARGIDFEINNDLLHRFLYEDVSSAELLEE